MHAPATVKETYAMIYKGQRDDRGISPRASLGRNDSDSWLEWQHDQRCNSVGLNHASKNNNNKEKAALFNQFIKLAGSSIYSYSTVQDKMHSVASANIAEKSYWDSFLSVACFEDVYYNVIFSFRSIDSDVRGQIYDSWIKKEANASHGVGTQNESANELPNYGSQIASTNIIPDNSPKSNTPYQKPSGAWLFRSRRKSSASS